MTPPTTITEDEEYQKQKDDEEDHWFEVHCMQMAALGDERYI